MAGTVVVKMSNPDARDWENIVTIDWTASAGGVVTAALAALFAAAELAKGYPCCLQPAKFKGYIRKIVTAPGANGDLATNKPSNAYSITLTDAYGVDVTGGTLASNSGTVGAQDVPAQPIVVDSELTLNIASAGGNTQGRTIITFSGSREGSSGPHASA